MKLAATRGGPAINLTDSGTGGPFELRLTVQAGQGFSDYTSFPS